MNCFGRQFVFRCPASSVLLQNTAASLQTASALTLGGIRKRRTKIIATIGPATCSDQMMRELMLRGMDCARINFNFWRNHEVKQLADRIRAISQELNRPVALLGDLAGSRSRLCKVFRDIPLTSGKIITLSTEGSESTSDWLCVSKSLSYCREGQPILLNDHQIELRLHSVHEGGDVSARIVKGGLLPYHRLGMHIPHDKVESLTITDLEDIDAATAAELDFITLSYVESRAHVRGFKELLAKKKSKMEVIAKIETRSGFNRVDEIAEEAFGVLICRGELALELSIEEIAFAQKKVIASCRARGKPSITATQILESMTDCAKPTRAEATDVANAILDGADALMLAPETAVGHYPLEALTTLDEIACKTDAWMSELSRPLYDFSVVRDTWKESFCTAAVALSNTTTNIVVHTNSGELPRLLSRSRPRARVVAISGSQSVVNKMQIVWGVFCVNSGDLPRKWISIRQLLLANGCATLGDQVVILNVRNEDEINSPTTLSVRQVEPIRNDARTLAE